MNDLLLLISSAFLSEKNRLDDNSAVTLMNSKEKSSASNQDVHFLTTSQCIIHTEVL